MWYEHGIAMSHLLSLTNFAPDVAEDERHNCCEGVSTDPYH